MEWKLSGPWHAQETLTKELKIALRDASVNFNDKHINVFVGKKYHNTTI